VLTGATATQSGSGNLTGEFGTIRGRNGYVPQEEVAGVTLMVISFVWDSMAVKVYERRKESWEGFGGGSAQFSPRERP
jgi:hypothetical protein